MFFTASKLVWFGAAPTNFLLIGLAASVLMRWMGFPRLGRTLGLLSSVSLLIGAFSPAGNLLLRPLEQRFPTVPTDAPAPTGIIVLGGSTDEEVSDARQQPTVASAAGRVIEAVALSRRFPDARLVFTGGSAALLIHRGTEADVTRRLWIAMGVPPERITTEDASRNTFENALFTQRLVGPQPGERWLLVTSAFHMPRAVGTFRAANFPVVPYPVDYRTRGNDLDLMPRPEAAENLRRVDTAVREWVGLAVYYATGRIGSLFPGL